MNFRAYFYKQFAPNGAGIVLGTLLPHARVMLNSKHEAEPLRYPENLKFFSSSSNFGIALVIVVISI
jgi:hypothetical protein